MKKTALRRMLGCGVVLGGLLSGSNAFAQSCSTDAWTSTSDATGSMLSAETATGYEGSCVLRVTKNAGQPINDGAFVRYDFAAPEPQIKYRFVVDPSSMSFQLGGPGGERRGRIFDLRKPDSEPSPRLLLSALVRTTDNGSGYQANFKWIGDGPSNNRTRGRCTDSFFDIPSGPSNIQVEYSFESGTGAGDGICRIYLDGTLVQEKTNLSNGALNTGSIRLGLIRGFRDTYSGSVILDAFEMRRQTLPDPVTF